MLVLQRINAVAAFMAEPLIAMNLSTLASAILISDKVQRQLDSLMF